MYINFDNRNSNKKIESHIMRKFFTQIRMHLNFIPRKKWWRRVRLKWWFSVLSTPLVW